MIVKLTYPEILMGSHAGCMRQVENLKKNRKPAHKSDRKDDWQMAIEGALGEMALAKYLRVYWSGKGQFRGYDVANMQVRTTPYDNGCLILHPDDDDEHLFWLMTGLNGTYKPRGWIYAGVGKEDKFWRDDVRNPAFFVPQEILIEDPQ